MKTYKTIYKGRRRTVIEMNGRVKSVSEWAAELGIGYSTFKKRLETMSLKEAFTKPCKHRQGGFTRRKKKEIYKKDWVYVPPAESLL